jgi:hypothetical protein
MIVGSSENNFGVVPPEEVKSRRAYDKALGAPRSHDFIGTVHLDKSPENITKHKCFKCTFQLTILCSRVSHYEKKEKVSLN